MKHTTIGFIVLGTLTALTLAVFSGIPRRAYDTRGATVKLVFADTALMSKKTVVRIHGVPVGRVKDVALDPGARSATVEVSVRDEGLPLYADASAQLKFGTLLGGNYTIDIDPGTAGAGTLDPLIIGERNTTSQVELDQVLEPFQAEQRNGLQSMLHELQRAFRDAEAPARALGALEQVSPALTGGLHELRGTFPARDVRDLVSNTARTVRALEAPPGALGRFVEGGALTVHTTAQREADIRSMIARTARVLPQVGTTMRQLNRTLGLADPLIADLQAPAGDVAPAVSVLRPTLVGADRLLREARPLLHSLRPATTALAGAARRGRPLLDGLAPSLRRVDRRILPPLALRDPVSHRATYEMLGPGVAVLHGMGSSIDDVAGLVNLGLGAGERALDTLPCHTYFTDPTPAGKAQRIRCKEIGDALDDYLNYSPVPERGTR